MHQSINQSINHAQAAIEAAAAIPAAEQRLIFKGKVLKDEQTLKFYGTRDPPAHVVCCLTDGRKCLFDDATPGVVCPSLAWQTVLSLFPSPFSPFSTL